MRCNLGRGTNAASRCMNSSGLMITTGFRGKVKQLVVAALAAARPQEAAGQDAALEEGVGSPDP
ncbi:MAG: hypothetical protein ACK5WT_02835, partial [Betaproteobacteria bacterium]